MRVHALFGIVAAGLLYFGTPLAETSRSPNNKPAAGARLSTTDLVARVQPSVVKIEGTTISGESRVGAGFVVDAAGIVVTNYHVVSGLREATLTLSDGERYEWSAP